MDERVRYVVVNSTSKPEFCKMDPLSQSSAEIKDLKKLQ